MSTTQIKPLSKVDIWNRALVRFGKEKVQHPDEKSKAADAFRIVYPQVLLELLAHESFPWDFATRVKALAPAEKDPATGYSYAYQLPPDCVTVTRLTNKRAHYEKIGNQIHTNESEASLMYVCMIDQPSLFPPEFVKALALHLAYEVAFEYYKKSAAFLEKLEEKALVALDTAKTADARQSNEAVSQTSIFEQARFGEPPGERNGVYTEMDSVPFTGEDW